MEPYRARRRVVEETVAKKFTETVAPQIMMPSPTLARVDRTAHHQIQMGRQGSAGEAEKD
jgi:hypothetical protein